MDIPFVMIFVVFPTHFPHYIVVKVCPYSIWTCDSVHCVHRSVDCSVDKIAQYLIQMYEVFWGIYNTITLYLIRNLCIRYIGIFCIKGNLIFSIFLLDVGAENKICSYIYLFLILRYVWASTTWRKKNWTMYALCRVKV